MTNPICQVSTTIDGDSTYESLRIICPACMLDGSTGLNILPISGADTYRPVWEFDGNLEKPTLSPSVLTRYWTKDGKDYICHSFLENGVWRYLSDSTHELKGQTADCVPLPDWVVTRKGPIDA